MGQIVPLFQVCLVTIYTVELVIAESDHVHTEPFISMLIKSNFFFYFNQIMFETKSAIISFSPCAAHCDMHNLPVLLTQIDLASFDIQSDSKRISSYCFFITFFVKAAKCFFDSSNSSRSVFSLSEKTERYWEGRSVRGQLWRRVSKLSPMVPNFFMNFFFLKTFKLNFINFK